MKQSDNISGLLKALCAAQAEFPTMPKDSAGYGYKYTNLDTIVLTIKPILAKHNLGYIQPITTAFLENQKPCTAITTRIFNSDGEYIEDTVALPEVSVGKANTAQNIGAAITYMRRYGLCSMLGITSDEDVDGNVQTHQMQQNQQQRPQQQPKAQPQRNATRPQQNGPAGGADTPAQSEAIKNILNTLDEEGHPLFDNEYRKNISNLRRTNTAEEVIRIVQAERDERLRRREKEAAELDEASALF